MAQTNKPARKRNVKKAAVKRLAPKKPAKKVVARNVRKAAKKASAKRVSKPAKKAVPRKVAKSAGRPSRKRVAKVAARKAKKAVRRAVKKSAAKKGATRVAKGAPQKKPAVKKTAARAADSKARAKTPVVQYAYGAYDGVVVCEHPGTFPKTSPYSKSELLEVRNLLTQERDRLREVLRDLDEMTLRFSRDSGENAVPGYSIHLAEDASDSTDMDTALLLRRDEESSLVQVDAALDRLDDHLFGVCVGCGDKIGMNRLRVKPDAHLCMKCRLAYDKNSKRF